jgi:methyl-accepting chemotaxis protein
MRSIDLALPFNWLARILGSFSVRTPIIVLALIPVAGFLANGVTYVCEGDVGRADATVTQSHALVDSNRDFKSAVEAEGLEAQVRQFLTNVQAA